MAINDFLVMVHEENPAFTIWQLRGLVTDRKEYILFPEAVEVLDAHAKTGSGDRVPEWR